MSDKLDDFVNDLQGRIFEETRAAYGELGFERWRNPLYQGAMQDAHGRARLKGTCGDTMQLFLKFEQGRVVSASYLTDGCGASTVCGSLAAEMAHGCTPEAIADITGETILELLGVFPEEDRHCAFLAAATLQEALSDYMRHTILDADSRIK
ncbi:iron-sulfur cluster assembly scaffold protein [Desulfatitalea alkaliphila]|uniref:Iron-sulfur cluster assembly scaffold protein n=1 Tax=Desulfatitalea alkaliphila TaxID=2929485 RepID=A0AA41R752_9BACT|nr:iron-sulfur cluster assembly scaffold protein [Desulfatitalea alkaliphila]MCJ8502698.1 iron-sulfur cluster assembly scaffold protein [Desulfatitalea alkaliphila]